MNEYEVGIAHGAGTVLTVRADCWEEFDGMLRFLRRDKVPSEQMPTYTRVCDVSAPWWLWVKLVKDDGQA